MKKRKICLVTKWYPTPENPSSGIFFKKQAFAVADYFDFLVIHYYESMKIFPIKKYNIEKCNREKNTVEYNVYVYIPAYIYILNFLNDLRIKHVIKKKIEGVGKFEAPQKIQFLRHILKKIFIKEFDNSFDVLYCVDAQTEASTLKIISEITGKPYVVSEHAPFPWPGKTIKEHCKISIEQANLFLAISYDKIRQLLLQNIKLPETIYIGNLVDEEQFNLKPKDENQRIKTFLIVAAHSFFKNYDLFIHIMNRLTEITKIPFKVLIVGYGSDKGYSKKPEVLEQKVKNSKFADCAELIPEVSYNEMAYIYGRADAFIMTSIQEGQPVSALEAACCGLPIFSTMCGGVEDYVTEDIGRIYKVTDKESFAYGLKAYLEGRISFDSEHIRRQIINMFGKKVFVEKFSKAFEDAIRDNAEGIKSY